MRKLAGNGLAGTLFILLLVSVFPLSTASSTGALTTSVLDPAASPWELIPGLTGTMYAMDMVDSTDGWAGGLGGNMYQFVGSAWQSKPASWDHPVRGLDMVNGTDGWGTTFQGEMIRYDGFSWTIHSEPATAPLDDVYMLDAFSGWAVGGRDSGTGRGTIVRYNGASWSLVDSGVDYQLKAIDMLNASDGWAVGIGGSVSHWNGFAWSGGSVGPGLLFFDVDMVASNNVWLVGADGVIYHYTGSSWSSVSSPTGEDLQAVHMVAADDGWAVGSGGTILHYDGSQWKTVASPTTNDLFDIHMLSASDGWAVGKGGTFLHYKGTFDLSTSTKSVSPRHASEGETLTYTIRVKNTGNVPAPNIEVTDAIPLGTTYVPSSANPAPASGPTPLVWTLGDLDPGSTEEITFQVTVNYDSVACWFVINEATIGSDTVELTRRASTTVGDCQQMNLPLIRRRSP